MHSLGIVSWIVIGLLAGWIAGMVMNRHHGLFVNLVIGLIGAVLGGWIVRALGFYPMASLHPFWTELGVSLVGAIVLLFLLGLFRRREA